MISHRIFSPGNVWTKSAFIAFSFFLTGCFLNPEKADITTTPISNLQSNGTATTGGTINSDGGSDIFQKGICFGSTPHPTIAAGPTNDGGGSGSFETSIQLPVGVTSYIRAYAVNGAGVAYGNEIVIDMIGVTLVDLFYEGHGTASAHGHVNASSQVQSRGVCWGTSENPTINDSKTNEGTATGTFTSQITSLSPGTTYYVRAYAVTDDGIFYSDNGTITTYPIPTLTTKAINNAGTFIVNSGGDITNMPGQLLHIGVCWSTSSLPTVNDPHTDDYMAYTSFHSEPTGLQPGTMYYLRAYATNVEGTGYGNQVTVTMPTPAVVDVDGNSYSSTTIGTQVWLVENLKTTKFSNGDPIPQITNDTDLRNTATPGWMYYAYVPEYNFPYGKLYNWYAVTDSRNVCPTGWHVPTDDEWMMMLDHEGGIPAAGNKILEGGFAHWQDPNPSTNSSGLTILPGAGQSADFYVYSLPSQGLFWTVTSQDNDYAWSFNVWNHNEMIYHQPNLKKSGLAVRCVKN